MSDDDERERNRALRERQTQANDSVEQPREIQAQYAYSTPPRSSSNQATSPQTPIETPEGVSSSAWAMTPRVVQEIVASAKKEVSTLEAKNQKLERRVDEGHEMAKSLTKSVESAVEASKNSSQTGKEVAQVCQGLVGSNRELVGTNADVVKALKEVVAQESRGQNGIGSGRGQDSQSGAPSRSIQEARVGGYHSNDGDT